MMVQNASSNTFKRFFKLINQFILSFDINQYTIIMPKKTSNKFIAGFYPSIKLSLFFSFLLLLTLLVLRLFHSVI